MQDDTPEDSQSEPPISSQPPPPRQIQQYQPDRRKDSTPPWKKAAEIAAIAIAGGLLIVNIFALRATRKAADAAKKSADTSETIFKLTYKPRLRFAGIDPLIQTLVVNGKAQTEFDKGRFRVSIDVPNMGLLPARNLRFFRYETISPRDEIAKREYQKEEELTGEPKILYPRTEAANAGMMIITGEKVPTADELKGLQAGTSWDTFSILIMYEDDFGDIHHSEYCGIFTLKPDYDICPWPAQND